MLVESLNWEYDGTSNNTIWPSLKINAEIMEPCIFK